MDFRFLSALLGLLLVGGSGGLWLLYNIQKRKKLLRNLLSLPKERRFFWYMARKAGFKVVGMDCPMRLELLRDEMPVTRALKSDFLLKRGGRTYNGLFFPESDERETVKVLAAYMLAYRTAGAVFYDETTRRITVWEKDN